MTKFSDSACEFGAKRLADGAVRFRLWAPAQETVSVAIESGDLLPMRRSADGLVRGDGGGTGSYTISVSPV